MRLLIALFVICAMSTSGFAAPARDGQNTRKASNDVHILSSAGIKSAAEIESVILSYPVSAAYKVTYKKSPDLIRRTYDAIEAAYKGPSFMPEWVGPIALVLLGGKVLHFGFCDEPLGSRNTVFLTQRYFAPKLLPILDEIKINAEAAALDSQVGDFDVYQLMVRTPYSRSTPWVPPSSEEGKAVIAKAKTIVDWLDPRTARTVPIDSGDIGKAESKFGGVAIYLTQPIRLNLEVWDKSKQPRGFPDPIGHDISFKSFKCSAIWVMDYGNYTPPVVIFEDSDSARKCYLCPTLERRGRENYGVKKLGFPGHPLGDTEYYKTPEVLYKELQELTKKAYDAYAKD